MNQNQPDTPPPALPRAPCIPTRILDDPDTIAIMRNWMARSNPPNFHGWMLGAARGCNDKNLSAAVAYKLLRQRADRHNRPVPDEEIHRAVEGAYHCAPGILPTSQRPYQAVANASPESKIHLLRMSKHWPASASSELFSFMADKSNLLLHVPEQKPVSILKILYAEFLGRGYFITLGWKQGGYTRHQTYPLEVVLGNPALLEGKQFLVPNLAVKSSGTTNDGKPSTRSLDMFEERQYLVTESDVGSDHVDIQMALIHVTRSFLGRDPVLVTHSGNKSYHAWWNTRGLSEDEIRDFFDFTAPLIDRATLTRNQFVRLPNGQRESCGSSPGQKQFTLYLNASNLAVSTRPPVSGVR